jgi:hypothetical protein
VPRKCVRTSLGTSGDNETADGVLRCGGELPFEFHHQVRQLADVQTEI